MDMTDLGDIAELLIDLNRSLREIKDILNGIRRDQRRLD